MAVAGGRHPVRPRGPRWRDHPRRVGYRGHRIRAHAVWTPAGLPCAAVLAVVRGASGAARNAAVREWGGDARRTYGPRPAGSHIPIPALRDDTVPLPGVPDGPRVVVCEGMETTAALAVAVGGIGAACVDAGHVASLLRARTVADRLRAAGAHLVVAVDVEPSGTGRRAAAALLRLAAEHGIPAIAVEPPARYLDAGGKADWADVLSRDPEGAAAAAREAAEAALARRIEAEMADAEALEAKRQALPGEIAQVLQTPGGRRLLAPSTGTGKSHAAAAAATTGATLLVGDTRAARDGLAAMAGATVYPARSPHPGDPGCCARYDEVVEPLARQRRGITLLACITCPLGQAAMDAIRAAPDRIGPMDPRTLIAQGICPYIWHTEAARRAEAAAATSAKLMGDPDGVGHRRGAHWHRDARAVVVHDCPEVTREETARIDDVLQWARTAGRRAAIDDAVAQRPDADDAERRQHQRSADGLRGLRPHLDALAQWVAQRGSQDGQVRLDPAQWAALADAAQDPAIRWVDATGAEAILRGDDGTQEIPLRALQSLGRATRRGTAWVRRGVLVWHSPSPAADLLLQGHRAPVVWLDATPSPHLRRLVQAVGGQADDPDPLPGNVHVTQVFAGAHGKAACADGAPSQTRERDHLLAAIRAEAAALAPGESMAVVAHMALARRLGRDYHLEAEAGERECGYVLPPEAVGRDDVTVHLGWWGRHGRAHNAWLGCTALLVYGVPQLSPTAAERAYVAAETVLREAGDPDADPTWDPRRASRTYRVPGQPREITCEGWPATARTHGRGPGPPPRSSRPSGTCGLRLVPARRCAQWSTPRTPSTSASTPSPPTPHGAPWPTGRAMSARARSPASRGPPPGSPPRAGRSAAAQSRRGCGPAAWQSSAPRPPGGSSPPRSACWRVVPLEDIDLPRRYHRCRRPGAGAAHAARLRRVRTRRPDMCYAPRPGCCADWRERASPWRRWG
jgi:hypothetical protein